MNSDTDKCPKCGAHIEISAGSFWWKCSKCDWMIERIAKNMPLAIAYMAAMHRIRELEARIETLELTVKVLESDKQTRNDALDHQRARIAAKDDALSRIDGYTGEAWTEELAREALKK